MTIQEDIKNAVECMRKGGVILYPTDTVWGIGCDATNPEAVAKVYQIKQRDDSKALICLVDSDARMQKYFRNIPSVAWELVDSTAEGGKPTTIILDDAVNVAHRQHQCQYQRTACRAKLLRHCPRSSGGRRLCVLESQAGAQTSHTEQHHQVGPKWRSNHYQKVEDGNKHHV